MNDGEGPSRPSGRRVMQEIRWLALGQLASQVTWHVMVVVLAVILEPRAFGTVAAGLAIVGVATLIMQSGTGGSLIAAPDLAWPQVRASILRTLLAGLALTATIAVLAQPLASLVADGSAADVLRGLGASVTILALSVVPVALLRKALNFKRLAGIVAAASLVTSVVAITAAVLGAGVWALVVRQLLYQTLIAGSAWFAIRRSVADLRRTAAQTAQRVRRHGRWAFLVVSSSSFLALSVDNLVVGASTSTTQLGHYALAFTLGLAPLTQFSWQIGSVLFPAAAATRDLDTVGWRTVRVIRIMGLLLFPLVPPVLTLAPVLVPTVLGPEWRPMVTPFQILFVVGVSHAVYNTIADSLSGTGNIAFRARIESVWAIGTILAIVALVHLYGIRGAAAGHAIALVPLMYTYIVFGARRIGTSARQIAVAVRDVCLAVALQGLATLVVLYLLRGAGTDSAGAAAVASVVGLLAAGMVLGRAPSRPLRDGRALLKLAVSRNPVAGPAA
jgi:O-antigen/teichoic acid export membrane protein